MSILKHKYRLRYYASYLRYIAGRLRGKKNIPQYDLVMVTPQNSAGWILDGICKEMAKFYTGTFAFAYSLENLPPAKNYFFSHYDFFTVALKLNPHLWGTNNVAFYTHPKFTDDTLHEFIYTVNLASKVICMNSESVPFVVGLGLDAHRVDWAQSGADPEIFRDHPRTGNGYVGICTAYYERKNPDVILSIIQNMPHRKFMLLGKNWTEYPRYKELVSCTNLEIHENIPYEKYPDYYDKMDVFISVSQVEGGPVPLIESMMSNVVPVVSHTGFAPDIISHGKNGFIFPVNAPVEEITPLIDKAFAIRINVRDTVRHLTWRHFTEHMQKFFIK
jgi:glycosyltransferase involved in cell wall biosynthesis